MKSVKKISKSSVNNSTPDVPIEVVPPQIVFHNIEPKKLYELKFAIRNRTEEKQIIKLTQPKSSYFKIEYNEISSVAPGLSLIARVIFKTNIKEEFFDNFKVYTKDY